MQHKALKLAPAGTGARNHPIERERLRIKIRVIFYTPSVNKNVCKLQSRSWPSIMEGLLARIKIRVIDYTAKPSRTVKSSALFWASHPHKTGGQPS